MSKSKDRYYYSDGSILDYYNSGKILHREDGPAVELTDGSKSWYHQDERHRDNGLPAIEYANGSKVWYCRGKYLFCTGTISKGKLTKEDANLLCLAHFGCEVQLE